MESTRIHESNPKPTSSFFKERGRRKYLGRWDGLMDVAINIACKI